MDAWDAFHNKKTREASSLQKHICEALPLEIGQCGNIRARILEALTALRQCTKKATWKNTKMATWKDKSGDKKRNKPGHELETA